MTHPFIAQALADARRDDVLRAVARQAGRAEARRPAARGQWRSRVLDWLRAPLRHRRVGVGPQPGPVGCSAVTR
jgi:hypothetical protein